MGQYNTPPVHTWVPVDAAELRDAAGTYRFDDGFEIRVIVARGEASLSFPDNKTCALVTEDQRHFQCADSNEDRLEFIRDSHGRVTHFLDNNTDIGRKIR